MTKSGTNAFHGDLTEQYWNNRWNGARFFVKQNYYRSINAATAAGDHALADRIRNTPVNPAGHANTYGATIGGPVIIPKLVNGKNKLFFFFSFDGFIDRKPTENTFNHTVPTLPERRATSPTCCRSAPPSTSSSIRSPSGPIRAAPAILCAIRSPATSFRQAGSINPAYQTYTKFEPIPNNLPPAAASSRSTIISIPASRITGATAPISNRFDYQLSEKHRFFGRWSWLKYREDRQDWTYETARGLMTNGVNRNNLGATANWVYTPTANTMLDVAAGGNNNLEGNILTPMALSYTPAPWACPHIWMRRRAHPTRCRSCRSPATTPWANRSPRGRTTRSSRSNRTSPTFAARTRSAPGSTCATIAAPAATPESRRARSISRNYTCQQDDCLTAGNLGHSWAAFLMGLPTTSTEATNATYALSNPYLGWYAQDNWRLSSKFSLNIGLRLEYEFGLRERYNRFIAGFDPTQPLPITALAQAAYAKAPGPRIAGLRVFRRRRVALHRDRRRGQPFSRGTIDVSTAHRVRVYSHSKAGDSRRLRRLLRHVERAEPGSGSERLQPDDHRFLFQRFRANLALGRSRAGISPLTDPFPLRSDGTRFEPPVGAALGSLAKTGSGWTFLDPNYQRRASSVGDWKSSANSGTRWSSPSRYAGMYANHVRLTRKLDFLPAQYWAFGATRNNTIATNMNQNVTNPFYLPNFASLQTSNPVLYQALASRSFFTSPTIRKNQLLRPFSQMNGLSETGGFGETKGESVEVVFNRRFGQGFTVNANFTGLVERDRDFFSNEFDPTPTWELSNNGTPWRFALTGIWELPFGRGRWLAHGGVSNAVLGGWQVAAATRINRVPLLNWGNLFYTRRPEQYLLRRDAHSRSLVQHHRVRDRFGAAARRISGEGVSSTDRLLPSRRIEPVGRQHPTQISNSRGHVFPVALRRIGRFEPFATGCPESRPDLDEFRQSHQQYVEHQPLPPHSREISFLAGLTAVSWMPGAAWERVCLRELTMEGRMNGTEPSIFDLSPAEKLQLVEDLWDDLAATPEPAGPRLAETGTGAQKSESFEKPGLGTVLGRCKAKGARQAWPLTWFLRQRQTSILRKLTFGMRAGVWAWARSF